MKPTSLLALGLFFGSLGATQAAVPARQTLSIVADTAGKAPINWFNLDPVQNGVPGVSTEKAYEYLKNRSSKTVVVAVIDSGIDINHEDLKDKIWTNEKEVPRNGVDDDKNGYVDDVHGWNFIGGKDGRNVKYDTQELTRLYVTLKNRFEGAQAEKFKKKDKAGFEQYLQIKKAFEYELKETEAQYEQFQKLNEAFKMANGIVQGAMGKDEYTLEELEKLKPANEQVAQAKTMIQYMAQNKLTKEAFAEGEDYFLEKLKYNLNPNYDSREIVGDDPNNIKEKGYGNNDVVGPFAEHGTHVAGIIAANRTNAIGIKGIADNVKIMVVRAVPNGDERDKDVANAIYYAVNNGAKVINMSFGKEYSPNKEAVDDAIKYAASKGVLLVHGAGNDSKNIDNAHNYPSKKIDENKEVKNWVEVGASSWGDATNFVGDFSNYGKKTVDVFAPGVDIYSTIPSQKYKNNSGTSMAAPVTAGIGALLFSYFPNLTAEQIREIILKSTVKYTDKRVNKPSEDKRPELVKFDELSVTGGIVNAYEAVKLAESMSAK
ncbi:S8 family peptidase [Adhaeribacter aquaticus]|uniref:S8 family peptidase n=1 Tax=Adhaeribacter aquaticus TaxID=299567 RepID=UPI0003FCE473|nr:S8 family peptidase [Adhaeribacter aquaticus]